jgi:hypothetical protein
MYGDGIWNFSDLVFDQALRCPYNGRAVDQHLLARAYGASSIANVTSSFAYVAQLLRQRPTNPTRIANRIRRTKPVPVDLEDAVSINDDSDDEGPRAAVHVDHVDFELAELNFAFKPPPAMEGDDVQMAPFEHEAVDIDALVTGIWRQFAPNIFAVGPNKRSRLEGSHLLLNEDQIHHASTALFSTLDARGVLAKVQVRPLGAALWRTLLFDKYFPDQFALQQQAGVARQNWNSMGYYTDWCRLVVGIRPRTAVKEVKARLWVPFRKLLWLPMCSIDRVWDTRNRKHQGVTPAGIRQSMSEACPIIALNESQGALIGRLKVGPKPVENES